MRLEVCRQLGIGRFEPFTELVSRERHDRELDLFVTALVFVLDVLVADGDPVRQRGLEFFERDPAPDLFLEVVRCQRRILQLEQLTVALLADELPVLHQAGHGGDSGADFFVGRVNPEARGFGERCLFLDHLLHDPLIDAELLEHPLVDVAAELRPVCLHLPLVRLAEAAHRDLATFDRCHDVVVAGGVLLQKTGNVKEYECQDHSGQAPFEPALVSAHPVEHRHGFGSLFCGGSGNDNYDIQN